VPHSILLGRGWPAPGEPLFTRHDTDLAVALAEEEADTCEACGLPKAWCRDNADGRYRFDVEESWCWATYRVASRQDTNKFQKAHAPTKRATQMRPKFRKGYEPDLTAGLGLEATDG
jgi:hypothetical protein